MEEIMKIAKRHNLFVIEDNAQAIGCDYTFSDGTRKKTGTIGHIGALLFILQKTWVRLEMAEQYLQMMMQLAIKLKMIANHGQSKPILS